MLEKQKINKKLLIALVIVLILFAILETIKITKENAYTTHKVDSSKEYVYTKYHSDTNKANIPYINIVGVDAKTVNEKIVTDSKEYLTSTTENKTVTYRYNQNKNILSVVLTYREFNSNNELVYSYKTYVFDLKNNCKLLSDDDIINKFSITYKGVNDVMASLMKEKYNDEVKEGYLDSKECDYNCFLDNRNISNYIDNANYYIENGHLVVYRVFDVYSIQGEEKYFRRSDFKFIIK